MGWAAAAMLMMLWVLGLFSEAPLGAWLHQLLAFAFVALVLGAIGTLRRLRAAGP